MLKPDERAHLLELLRPPAGCRLDFAVGTTFSLDLISALMLPLSFAFFDWEKADGELVADPLALLEALRRYGDRFTVFCQSGQMRLPAKYPPLVTFLEPCIYEVQPRDRAGVFHPKFWAPRFIAEDGAILYRVLCLSRNLTFDRCWDTVVALDGELSNRTNAIAVNHPLGEFVKALPGLALRPVEAKRRQAIAKISDELRRVRFTWPEGFDERLCRFWVAGLDGRTAAPFGSRRDKALIVSPFLTETVVTEFLDNSGETHLVSRQECLQVLPQKTLRRCKSVRFLAPEVVEETDDNAAIPESREVLDGLHAKLFVIDRGWDASVFSGSFNATVHALHHNVEFMVELVGKKSRFGVDQFLRQVKGETAFADLLRDYDVTAPAVPADAAAQQLDDLIFDTKRVLIASGPRLTVTIASEPDLFDLHLECARAPKWPSSSVVVRAWPITQHADRAQLLSGSPLRFSRVSFAGLTPLIAFEVSAQVGERTGKSIFVMNLILQGTPEDRQDRVVRSLIENRDQLLRYILFLLASGDEAAASSGDLRRLLEADCKGGGGVLQHPYLLETLLRALHRGPAQLSRVASLLDVLKKQPGSSELLGDDFQKIWEPILGRRPGGRREMKAPDTQSVLNGLKDFQRATVDYAFERFYGPDPTRRFLVADEVGLGKTLVARGVIARTIEHLRAKPRIYIVYICSNADIARQNIQRLRIPGCADAAQATRLTLLPLNMDGLRRSRINFVALTPATSFHQTAGGGRIDERALLYWLLDFGWKIHGSRASLYVMRDFAGIDSFQRSVETFDFEKVDKQVAFAFVSALERRVKDERDARKPDIRARFDELRSIFCRSDARVPDGATKQRTQWIGEVRRLLASVCLTTLEPDLIILDEFQRFKHLLDEESEAGELARDLFDSEAGQGARVLLLSATPYRGLSLHHETDDDHYGELLALLRFLENGDAAGCKEILAEYRAALPAVLTPGGRARLSATKSALQERLRRVMARTERLASSHARGGMLLDEPPSDGAMHVADVRAFLGSQRIAQALDQGDVIEYWKSAPYLFNFMDEYALKRAFREAPEQRDMMRFVRDFPEAFLDVENLRAYRPLEPANPRLRELLGRTLDSGMWKLLWIPPSLHYYRPSGPFAAAELGNVTKQLVFSAWHMVPRAVASLVSYEAERRMMRAGQPRGRLTQDDWKKQRGLLRFGTSSGRLTGMPLLLLVYPCLTFARDYDPRGEAREGLLTADEVRSRFEERLSAAVAKLGIVHESDGPVDERWYWLTPILLDFGEFPGAAKAWWSRTDLARLWAGVDVGEEDAGWTNHVEQAKQVIHDVRNGKDRLGLPPDDLFEDLALAASAAPATAALRTYARVSRTDPERSLALRIAAARTGRAFLTLFNHAEVTEAVRSEFAGEPYWERVLEYSHAGGLQAVLDEYAHLLRESLGLATASATQCAEQIASEVIAALTIRAASLRIDDVTAPPYAREVKISTEPMRIRFAMRFGDDRYDEESSPAFDGAPTRTRKESVRAAFNSPFWPFVLVSTTVGQEGLDFHHYCHSVTHWNLPSNPVDLEQREGRIHRYKGHAVRKNVAAAFAVEALACSDSDAWERVFELGRAGRPADKNDLVPYWIFPGNAKIERHVPRLPLSREVERLDALRRALAIYRMLFGQSRQEDLITYLLAQIPESERYGIVAELQIDLSPSSSIARGGSYNTEATGTDGGLTEA